MANAMAFFASDMSPVREGKRGLSWFSRNEPRRVVSAHSPFIVLIPLTRLLILPLVDSKAWVIHQYLFVVSFSLKGGGWNFGELRRIVEDPGHIALVRADHSWVSVVDFAYQVDSSY